MECGKIIFAPLERMELLRRQLRLVHRELGQEYQLLVQRGFEAEQSPAGRPWQALAPATAKKRGSAHPILRVSGRLARAHLRADATGAVVGSNLAYAAIHQHGGEVRRKGGARRLHFKKFQRGPRKGKILFSKAGKATYGMQASVGPYSIRIPARPWLYKPDGSIPPAWQKRLTDLVVKHLGDANA